MARRARFKVKKDPVKVEWERMPLIEKIVDDVAADHHPHLKNARIIVLGRPKASKRHAAVARKASRSIQALYKDAAGLDVHYLIEVGLDVWTRYTPEQRRILIDHELCHFLGLDDKGRWAVRPDHDIEEFTEIVKRHGAHHHDLQVFVKEGAKQMSLVEEKAGGTK
jgi:predicted metallopeptidase